jgi:LysR family transcriptional regulator, hydrogen peroxide-inducible genes activator
VVEPEVYRTVSIVTVRGRPHSPAVGAFVREAKRHRWDGSCTRSSESEELLAAG